MDTSKERNTTGSIPARKEQATTLADRREDAPEASREAVDEDGYLISTPTMPELTPHHLAIKQAIESLDYHLEQQGRNYLCAGDVHLYDRKGQRRCFLDPDILLFLTPPPGGQVRVYKAWEGDVPDLVVEVLSDRSRENDLGDKKARYARIGVAEYWLFAPPELPIEDLPALQGFRLGRQGYESIAPVAAQVKGYATDLYPSAVLDASWGVDANAELRLFSPLENDWCPLSRDVRQLLWQAQQQLMEIEARKRTERKRAEREQARAARARTRTQQAEMQAARARTRAQETIARLQRLLHEQGIALPDEHPENDA